MGGLQLEFTHIQWYGSIVDAALACMLHCEHKKSIHTAHLWFERFIPANQDISGVASYYSCRASRKFAELPTRLGVATHDSDIVAGYSGMSPALYV